MRCEVLMPICMYYTYIHVLAEGQNNYYVHLHMYVSRDIHSVYVYIYMFMKIDLC